MALALFKARSQGLQLIGQGRWPSRFTQRLNLIGRTLSVRFYPNYVVFPFRFTRTLAARKRLDMTSGCRLAVACCIRQKTGPIGQMLVRFNSRAATTSADPVSGTSSALSTRYNAHPTVTVNLDYQVGRSQTVSDDTMQTTSSIPSGVQTLRANRRSPKRLSWPTGKSGTYNSHTAWMSLSVPRCQMPANSSPIRVYAKGLIKCPTHHRTWLYN